MRFSDLNGVMDLQPEIMGEGVEYLAATPVVKQPATLPGRVVLVHKLDSDQLVVWDQQFFEYEIKDGHLETSKPFFANGSYFKPENLDRALQEFGRRTMRQGEEVASVFRSGKVAA